MKFSVLLPTRNRLELLMYAMESVRRQDYRDWEIIVSDNASDQDVEGCVRSYNDPRIIFHKTTTLVSVTENWNNALARSSGDYVIMLGDDDCLMKGYFSTLRQMIEAYGSPDVIYTSALLYAYPGVLPGYPDGFLQPYGYAEFLRPAKEPYWLDRAEAFRLVRKSADFRISFGFNMQFALIGRRLVEAVGKKGAFFQSPYPDYYAMNAVLLESERTLVCPYSLVAIGISPKSFGYYYFNQAERQGTEFLQNRRDASVPSTLETVVLPGTEMNTSWLLAMELLRNNYCSVLDLQVNYARYRRLQIAQICAGFAFGIESARNARHDLWNKISIGEKALAVLLFIFSQALSLIPSDLRRRIVNRLLSLTGSHPRYRPEKIIGRYRNILEVHERIDPRRSLTAPVES